MREADDKLLKHVTEVLDRTQEITAGIINGAKRDANEDSAQIIADAKNVAIKIISDARLRADEEARIRTGQETNRIISEARKEAIRIVSKARQEAEKESIRILTDNNMRTKTKYQKALLYTLIKDRIRKVAKQSTKMIASVKHKDNSNVNAIGEVVSTKRKPLVGQLQLKTDYDRLYQGSIQLEITYPIDYAEIITLQSNLREIANLRISSVRGSVAGNTTITVFLEEPMPIARILAEMPLISAVDSVGEKMFLLTSVSQG